MTLALVATCLLASLFGTTSAQLNPSAETMARTILNPKSFELVTRGAKAPKYSGPPDTSKLIRTWSDRNKFEAKRMPKGAVKILMAEDDSRVELRFSAISKVR
jgi:hypothetical protein